MKLYENTAYFNFDKSEEYKQFFETTKDVDRILQNLIMTGGYKVCRSSAPGLPVAAYYDQSAFKIYLVDVELLRRLAQLAPTAFGVGNRLFTEFKEALTENYVLQTLITQFEGVSSYWTQNNSFYEMGFLIQRGNDIFPVEVKSEANLASKSLRKFKELSPDKVKLRG